MVGYELKEYILDSCEFLDIEVVEQDQGSSYRLIIPPALQKELRQPYVDVTFSKTTNPNLMFLTFESFLTQKIAALVADRNDGISSGVIEKKLDALRTFITTRFVSDCKIDFRNGETLERDQVMMWSKITLQGYFIDEYIKGLVYSYKTGEVTHLPEDMNRQLSEIREELIEGISEEALDQALQKLMIEAEREAETFYFSKQREVEAMFQKEVTRINEYYKLLESENATAETSRGRTTAEELALLKNERENLIEQQRIKFLIPRESIEVEPCAVLLLRERVERGSVTIRNEYGEITHVLRADERQVLSCAVSGNTTGPFTITSDNVVALPLHTFHCTTCNDLKDHLKRETCSVCREAFCPNCTSYSELSKAPLCQEHKQNCQCCLRSVGVNEFHFCGTCHQNYCTECNPAQECTYCSGLSPIKGISPQLKQILDRTGLKASKYEISEQGNRFYVLGKGMVFKTFYLCYDVKEQKVLELQQFGLFNKKKS